MHKIEDRERWNQRYAAAQRISSPSSLLTELDGLVPRVGSALDVAGGSGRHALWLVEHGLSVTLIDVSDVALSLAQQAAQHRGMALATVQVDLERDPPPLGPFDFILISDYLQRPLLRGLIDRLSPHGLLLMIHPTLVNLERHPHPSARFLLKPAELAQLFSEHSEVEVLKGDEQWRADGRHVARALVRRRGR